MSVLTFEQDYIALFDNSFAYTKPDMPLHNVFCNYVSLYSVALRLLKELQLISRSKLEKDKILASNLTFLVSPLEKIVDMVHKFKDLSFVSELFLEESARFTAPPNTERVLLGDANLPLCAKLFVNRVDVASRRAMRSMRVKIADKYLPLTSLEKEMPDYFEWYGITSNTHLYCATQLVQLWRIIDETVVDKVYKALQAKSEISKMERENKINSKTMLIQQSDKKALENLAEPSVEIKVFAPIAPKPEINPWGKPTDVHPKIAEQQKTQEQQKDQSDDQTNKKKKYVRKARHHRQKPVSQQETEKQEMKEAEVIVDQKDMREWRDDDGKGNWTKKHLRQKTFAKPKKTFVMRRTNNTDKK